MRRNNVKLLTYEQQQELNDKYEFFIEDDNIIVGNKHYDRRTPHSLNESFAINSKVRKLTFTVQAMQIWIALKDAHPKYSLIDVQQAINALYITYQKVNEKSVLHELNKQSKKIRTI